MNIFGLGTQKKSKEIYSTPDDKRPVRLVQINGHMWHVVYADY